MAGVVCEEEQLVFLDRPANGATEFVLVISPNLPDGVEVVASIQAGVADELEHISMQRVGARFGNHIDLAAAVVAVFGVVVVGENAELGQRVKIGNSCGATVAELLNDKAIEKKAVFRLTLPVDRQRSGVETAGDERNRKSRGIESSRVSACHARGLRNHSRLQSQQIGVAPSDQWHRGHPL